jgi:putative ABC transport system permease protein
MRLFRRLQFLLKRDRFDSDLEEEMRLHRELRSEKLGDAGAVARRFGNATRLREESRDAWGWIWLESVAKDIRYALRVLKRSLVFTIATIATLALGIGANAALFTLVDALLLKPLPVHDPGRLVRLTIKGGLGLNVFCFPTLTELARRTQTLDGLFVSVGSSFLLGPSASTKNIQGAVVSGQMYRTLGIQAEAGRLIAPDDDQDADPFVAVLSDRFWQSEFNRDPNIIGRTILLDRHPFVVIGVTPRSFFGMSIGEWPDVTIPIHASALLNPQRNVLHRTDMWWMPIFGRLKPGVSVSQANAELRVLSRPVLASILPPGMSVTEAKDYFSQTFGVIPGAMGAQWIADRYQTPLLVLISISGLVLLIACVNISGLLLARAAARSREISIRLAVGGGRWRIVRQLITESALLSLGGTAAGAFFAWCSLGAVLRFLPFTLDLSPDLRVVAFLSGLAIVTALVFGSLPAWQTTGLHASESLKQGRIGQSKDRLKLGSLLVSGQVALSIVLVTGAFLFIRTFENLKWQNLGFNRAHLLAFGLEPGPSQTSGAQLAAFYSGLLSRLDNLPNVHSASLVSQTPMTGGYAWEDLSADFWPNLTREERTLYLYQVTPGFFKTMETPLLEGRDFDSTDATSAQPPPAIISKTAAQTYFRGGSAIGQILRINNKASYRVVGVARDAKFATLRGSQARTLYVDAMHNAAGPDSPFTKRTTWCLTVRSSNSLSLISSTVRSFIKSSGTDIVLTENLPVNEQIDAALRTERTVALLAAFFAAVAALLVAIGLYGLLAFSATRRTTEIGVRFALGASRNGVLWLILKDALLYTLAGTLVGIPAVLVSGKLVASMLYETRASDPVLLAFTTLALLLIAALASLLPAWRAATVDPTTALRWE